MAKTYVPKLTDRIHELAVYMARYNAIIRPALAVLDPDSLVAYDALFQAAISLDALREVLAPLVDSAG